MGYSLCPNLNMWCGRLPGYPGELFLNALQELVLPLIALALLNGVLSLRHSTAGCPPQAQRDLVCNDPGMACRSVLCTRCCRWSFWRHNTLLWKRDACCGHFAC